MTDREPPIKFGKPQFPVYCSWCAAKGISRIVGWSECEDSHGICKEHKAEMRREVEGERERQRELG